MIFTTVGTNEAAFDRLVTAVGALAPGEELVVQRGSSTVWPQNATTVHDFLPFDDLVEYVRAARLVISHAGVGSILVALANGKRPVVVPRRREFREAVDDHQVVFARRFAEEGLVSLAEPDILASTLESADPLVATGASSSPALVHELRDLIARTLAESRERPGRRIRSKLPLNGDVMRNG
jgi:UDP-N-acetylglucosamine transferase subunit ALG13